MQVYQLEATNIVQIVCYISSADYSSVVTKTWNEQFNDEDYEHDFEDLLTIFVMPRLPRNTKVEWHAIAAVDRKLSSVKYEKLNDYHITVSRCLSNKNEGEEKEVELVSEELNHLVAILHVYAGGLIFMK